MDIAPTLLDAAGVPAPESVFGVRQMSFDGKSLLDSFDQCTKDSLRTQYFEVGGKAGLYSDGWMIASANNQLAHLGPEATSLGLDKADAWRLYNLDGDFSQSTDLTDRYPDRRDALFDLWRQEAKRNNVLPIRGGYVPVKPASEPRNRYEFWGKDVSIPAHPNGLMGEQLNRSFTLTADLDVSSDASGVVAALGSRFAGWSLFLDEGRPVFVFARSIRPGDVTRIAATSALGGGTTSLELRFTTERMTKPVEVEIIADGKSLARSTVPANFNMPLGVGEMLDAGRDTGVPVTEYAVPQGVFEGTIRRVTIEYH